MIPHSKEDFVLSSPAFSDEAAIVAAATDAKQEESPLDPEDFEARLDEWHPALSTDYVNQFAEVSMLLELAALDETALHDLSTWSPKTYVEHFEGSELRGAAMALAGYRQLPADLKNEFDDFSELLVRLGQTSIAAMVRATNRSRRQEIAQTVSPIFQAQIARMTRFMNANGAEPIVGSGSSIQVAIDQLIEA